jgi:hypothetical protein
MSPVVGFYLLVAMMEVVVRGWRKLAKRASAKPLSPSSHAVGWAFTLLVPFAIEWLVPGRQSAIGLFAWWLGSLFAIGVCLGAIEALRGIR